MADDRIVEIADHDGITLVRIRTAALLNEEQVTAFGDALDRLADTPGRRIVLSFLGVEHLTSQALGKLIQAHKRLGESGGEMRLADIDPRIYEVFAITRLDKLFKVYEREDDALASYVPTGGSET